MIRLLQFGICLVAIVATSCAYSVTSVEQTSPPTFSPKVPETQNTALPIGWADTPAAGNPPYSTMPLPAGISNGMLISGGGVLWFIWANTRNRVWFPQPPIDSWRIGRDATGHLVGLQSDPNLHWSTRVKGFDPQSSQVYLSDDSAQINYPVEIRNVDVVVLNDIQVSIGNQYYPALSNR